MNQDQLTTDQLQARKINTALETSEQGKTLEQGIVKQERLDDDSEFRKILEEQSLKFLNSKNERWFKREFTGEVAASGYLIGKDGTETNFLPSQNLSGNNWGEVYKKTCEEFAKQDPEQALRYPETAPYGKLYHKRETLNKQQKDIQKRSEKVQQVRETLGLPQLQEKPYLTFEKEKAASREEEVKQAEIVAAKESDALIKEKMEQLKGADRPDHTEILKDQPKQEPLENMVYEQPDKEINEARHEKEQLKKAEAVAGEPLEKNQEEKILADDESVRAREQRRNERSVDAEKEINSEQIGTRVAEIMKDAKFIETAYELGEAIEEHHQRGFHLFLQPAAIQYYGETLRSCYQLLKQPSPDMGEITHSLERIGAVINEIGNSYHEYRVSNAEAESFEEINKRIQGVYDSCREIYQHCKDDDGLKDMQTYMRGMARLLDKAHTKLHDISNY